MTCRNRQLRTKREHRNYKPETARTFSPRGSTKVSSSRANAASARLRTSSDFTVPIGWRTITIGESGALKASRSDFARASNGCVITVTANLPRFWISMESWTLHDVHEPQSPRPLITKSLWAASSSKSFLGAPCCAVSLRRLTTPAIS